MDRGRLTVDETRGLIDAGRVDTVLMVFPDQQGRFMGKRVTGDFFLRDILEGEGAIHACNYLLAVDMEMEPLPGYAYANWDTGYGDLKAVPGHGHASRGPLAGEDRPGHLRRARRGDERAHRGVAAADPQAADRTGEGRRLHRQDGIGAGVLPVQGLVRRRGRPRAYRDLQPHSSYIMDYHILQTTKDEYLIRKIRNDMDAAGVPVEFSKGEFGKGQQEINLRYADALEMADRHTIYKNGVKEIASLGGRAVTFMAKWSMAEAGSSFHLHSSVWDDPGEESLMWDGDGHHHLSETFGYYLGGLMDTAYEMAWMFAPSVNSYKRYQLGSWAPTAIVWSHDNRTCGFRVVGEHQGFRVECRIPGADANPYYAFAATIAGGLHGIEHKIEAPEMFVGNAYEAKDVPRVPSSLHESIAAFEGSEVARGAFGDAVFEHLLNTARQEQIIFDNNVVTDWELSRYFERI